MTSSIADYLPRTPEYYKGFEDGYEVAKQEIKDFYERMGNAENTFTGTVCVAN